MYTRSLTGHSRMYTRSFKGHSHTHTHLQLNKACTLRPAQAVKHMCVRARVHVEYVCAPWRPQVYALTAMFLMAVLRAWHSITMCASATGSAALPSSVYTLRSPVEGMHSSSSDLCSPT